MVFTFCVDVNFYHPQMQLVTSVCVCGCPICALTSESIDLQTCLSAWLSELTRFWATVPAEPDWLAPDWGGFQLVGLMAGMLWN